VFDALLEARKTFTMVELGAGWGRWLVSAACAARVQQLHLELRLVGVEAQPEHFRWMRKHLPTMASKGNIRATRLLNVWNLQLLGVGY
jgi:hypothetical protein